MPGQTNGVRLYSGGMMRHTLDCPPAMWEARPLLSSSPSFQLLKLLPPLLVPKQLNKQFCSHAAISS